MNDIYIENILTFLDENKYDYEFVGNDKEKIVGYSTLFNYKKETMTFVSTLNDFKDYQHFFQNEQINLILCGYKENNIHCAENIIKTEFPKKVFFDLLDVFFDNPSESNHLQKYPSVNKSTFISENVSIGENVNIGHGCVIEDNVIMGNNTTIHHNVVVRSGTKIGDNCTIYSGAIIGERGFNPYTLDDGTREMFVHYGGVTIKNNVHIGENSCIVRGALDDTVIESGVKLNTMVHVAHNAIIGENTAITMPTHISGSVVIGANCHIAATSIRNQCVIGDGATLGLGSVVVSDVKKNETVVGIPAKPLNKRGR